VSMRLSEVLDGVGRPIAYFPKLAKFLGGVKVYILFCQLFYWSQRTNGSAWFFKYALWSPDNLAERLKISARDGRVERRIGRPRMGDQGP